MVGEAVKKKYISIAWDEFVQDVLPLDAPADQIAEMRKAFYAGATAMMQLMTRFATKTGLDQEVTDEDVRPLEELEAELVQFARDILREGA